MKGSKKRILDYMHIHKSITSAEAFTELGCTRLAARIKDLRDLGYNISTIIAEGQNRYGEPCRFAVYKLGEKEKEEKENGSEVIGGEISSR